MQNAAGAGEGAQDGAGKKQKISFEEFRKFSFQIIHIMKDYERAGEENVRQGDILEKMIQWIELENPDRQTSLEKVAETSKKINAIIQNLITSENILMITQDARAKVDRYLTLNVNVDMENLASQIQGSRDPVF